MDSGSCWVLGSRPVNRPGVAEKRESSGRITKRSTGLLRGKWRAQRTRGGRLNDEKPAWGLRFPRNIELL